MTWKLNMICHQNTTWHDMTWHDIWHTFQKINRWKYLTCRKHGMSWTHGIETPWHVMANMKPHVMKKHMALENHVTKTPCKPHVTWHGKDPSCKPDEYIVDHMKKHGIKTTWSLNIKYRWQIKTPITFAHIQYQGETGAYSSLNNNA